VGRPFSNADALRFFSVAKLGTREEKIRQECLLVDGQTYIHISAVNQSKCKNIHMFQLKKKPKKQKKTRSLLEGIVVL